MTSIINKAKEKVTSGGKTKSPSTTPDRSIPPEPVQQAPQGDFSGQDADPAMQVHNLARANKRCEKLEWSTDLAKNAQEHANVLAKNEAMQHSGVQGQGENLFMSTGDAELEQAVQSWLGEEKDYNGEAIGEGDLQKWGHYSQCLWSKTTHVGMGKATAKSGTTYIVARYSPPGNMQGEKPY